MSNTVPWLSRQVVDALVTARETLSIACGKCQSGENGQRPLRPVVIYAVFLVFYLVDVLEDRRSLRIHLIASSRKMTYRQPGSVLSGFSSTNGPSLLRACSA